MAPRRAFSPPGRGAGERTAAREPPAEAAWGIRCRVRPVPRPCAPRSPGSRPGASFPVPAATPAAAGGHGTPPACGMALMPLCRGPRRENREAAMPGSCNPALSDYERAAVDDAAAADVSRSAYPLATAVDAGRRTPRS